MNRVSSSKNGGSGVKSANDTGLSYGYSLLLHGFVEDHTRVIVHLVELIDATDASVREDKGATLKDKLTGFWVSCDIDGETNCGTSLA